jgi:hypothetical protein
LTQEHLEFERLRRVVAGIAARPESTFAGVVIDFSRVSELVGPWTPYLALLIQLARRIQRPIRVQGLHDQPMRAFRLYR